jgi:hypothetical protein
MKRVVFVLTLIFCCILPASAAYAGSLNANESQVVAAAKQVYIYQGKEYRVTEAYLNQLIDYLSSDEVDLTAEQRDEALQTAYGSIEQGVEEGYLVPVTTEKEAQPTKSPEATTENIPQDTTEEAGDAPTVSIPQPPITKPGTITVTPEPGNIVAAPGKEKEEIEKLFEAILSEESETKENTVSSVGADASIITDTGFNLSNTIIVIVGMMILMVFGFAAALRNDNFAHSDE